RFAYARSDAESAAAQPLRRPRRRVPGRRRHTPRKRIASDLSVRPHLDTAAGRGLRARQRVGPTERGDAHAAVGRGGRMIPKLRTDEHRRASARVPLEPQAAEAWIAAAGRAQRAWGAAPLKRRLQVLRRFRRLLAADAHAIAGCILRRPPFETVAAEVWPILEACRFLERKAPRILACRRPRALGWPAPGRARVAIA